MNSSDTSMIRYELEAIKRLMIFRLLNEGHSQAKIAGALGISQASISRLMSAKVGKD
jgi:predicted transcriptional regulator